MSLVTTTTLTPTRQVRLGEQEALDDALQWFESRQGTELKRLAYYQERRLRKLGLVDDQGRWAGVGCWGCGLCIEV